MREASRDQSRRSRPTGCSHTARARSPRPEKLRRDPASAIAWRRIPGNVLLGFLIADLAFVLI